jgi:hypothetical protein
VLAGDRGRVVLKGYRPEAPPTPRLDAVRVDLKGEDEVRAAFRELSGSLPDDPADVVVQPMAPRGAHLVAGVVQDGVFGPLVLLGPGGSTSEVLADRAARLAPLTTADVQDLLAAPGCAPLAAGDGAAGAGALLERLSAMACDLPQLAEADLNPVLVRPDGVLALDVRARVEPVRADDPYLRRLP